MSHDVVGSPDDVRRNVNWTLSFVTGLNESVVEKRYSVSK